MDKNALIKALAELIAGLATPPGPAEMPGAAAFDAWAVLHEGLIGTGPAGAADYEREIRKVLGLGD